MEVEPADLADTWVDQEVRRVAGEARAGDAVLHDVEGIDHHRGDAGPAAAAKKLALHGSFGREQPAEAALWRRNLDFDLVRIGWQGTVGIDGGGMGEDIAGNVGGD